MAYVILGLLLIRPQSLYDLVKSFEAGVSLFYSASTGSIKRALDGLLDRGRIEVASTEGGRGRKVYRVTDAGRDELEAWLTAEPTGDVETAALSRLYFLGLLPAERRRAVLERLVDRVEAGLADLERLGEQVADLDVPADQRDLARYQLATLEYGLGSYRYASSFFRGLLDEH
ncbi:MAG TPA: PadR family transcriptional regulator [Actinotalea caeni]|uniref:PadR family transcriptional regulator n=1 Tax=Actinotalea caeni TaxID=1348467 RepID=UPI002B4AC968|nr:PadR family transcriptional regulator [Actinotalea caeni]HLV54073.1 PadR family transcriptional regulator [Actinotalea caeni]